MTRNRALGSTLVGLTRALAHALVSEQVARERGFLQSLDPRVRVAGLLAMVLAVTLSHRISVVLALFGVAVLIALFSRVSLYTLATRVWLAVLLFTGVIALPAVFLTPGDTILTIGGGSLRVTSQGVTAALLLISRVETAVTFTTLLVLCTSWMHVLKALRAFHIPQEVVMMLAMTHRYIFLLAEELARAGVAAGLPPELATKLARETVAGSGELLHRSVEPSATLRQNVTSPGGTTAAALEVLMGKDGMQSLLTRAVAAATRRSKELAK